MDERDYIALNKVIITDASNCTTLIDKIVEQIIKSDNNSKFINELCNIDKEAKVSCIKKITKQINKLKTKQDKLNFEIRVKLRKGKLRSKRIDSLNSELVKLKNQD